MNGLMRLARDLRRRASECFSIGVRYRLLNLLVVPSNPGARNLNRDQSSPRWFSIGVPDRQSRCLAFSWNAVLVALAR